MLHAFYKHYPDQLSAWHFCLQKNSRYQSLRNDVTLALPQLRNIAALSCHKQIANSQQEIQLVGIVDSTDYSQRWHDVVTTSRLKVTTLWDTILLDVMD